MQSPFGNDFHSGFRLFCFQAVWLFHSLAIKDFSCARRGEGGVSVARTLQGGPVDEVAGHEIC